jgi:hypothetical protein
MLRNWHNSRAFQPIWRQLDLVLVTSTEPYQFVANLNLSPFNVGEGIDVPDFTPAQVVDLNQRHGAPLRTDEVQGLLERIGGHPFLVRRALYLIASERLTFAELLAQALEGHGPFGDHLRRHLLRLQAYPEMIAGLRQVLSSQSCADEPTFFRLQEAQPRAPALDISAESWNSLCWFGSLWGQAAAVLHACEQAVALASENGNIRDSRGIAPALTGDSKGAITDLQFYLTWAQGQQIDAALMAKPQNWIEALQTGQNPLDVATLEALR